MEWLMSQRRIVWTWRRVGLLLAVALVFGVVSAALDGLGLDLEAFGYDLSGWVIGGLIGLVAGLLSRRWLEAERA